MQVVAIGNAPSSGSTLLADLLDSIPYAVCGPEFRLLAVAGHYQHYERFRDGLECRSATASCRSLRLELNANRLFCYGLNKDMIVQYAKESDGFRSLVERVFGHFGILRNRDVTFAFEKTPQNIHAADLFLAEFSDSYFIHIVRDPAFVIRSLRRRGFSPYMALATWLIDVAVAYELRNHPRFISIRYEDLVAAPYRSVSDLMSRIGGTVDPDDLEAQFRTNRYRRLFSKKLETWSVKGYGAVQSANNDVDDESAWLAGALATSRVNPKYAEHFGIATVSGRELIEHYGYSVIACKRSLKPPSCSEVRKRLLEKWWKDFRAGDAGVSDLKAYLQPVTTS